MSRRLLIGIALLLFAFVARGSVDQGRHGTFVPDWTFTGSMLADWNTVGDASWRAVDGEIIGTPKTPSGGWLILDKSLQDVEFGAAFKCTGGCKTGVLLRAEKTPNGMKGVYVSVTEGDVAGLAIALATYGRDDTVGRSGRSC